MQSHYKEIIVNSVKESCADFSPAVSLGRTRHEQQVASDRQQATVCKPKNGRVNSEMRLATWNVRTLHQPGKLHNMDREMKRLHVDIMEVAEARWTGVGSVELPEGGCFIYSGGQSHVSGVGVALGQRAERSLAGYYAVSDRVLLVRLQGKPFDTCIIQVYAPTCDHSDEEVESFYDDVERAVQQCKRHDVVFVMGDMNAKVGRGREEDIVGPYGLGERNARGDRLVEWCTENEQVIMNTWYRHHARRLWTWKSPGDRCRNQIDFITINKRFRNSVVNVKTYPGADCNSDHVPVVADIRLKLKRPKKKQYKPKLDIKLLNDRDIQSLYSVSVRNKYEALRNENGEVGEEDVDDNPEQLFDSLKEAIQRANEEILPRVAREPKRPWMTDDILLLMEERRGYKERDEEKYREINRRIKRECLNAKTAWMNNACEEIEDLGRRDQTRMYSKVKEIAGRKRCYKPNIAIMKSDATLAVEEDEVKARWDEYIGELFFDDRPDSISLDLNTEGPIILHQEVRAAIESMKKGKAVGEDDISLEMITALGDFGIKELTKLFNKIYDTGNVISSLCESVFVALPKVEGTLDCSKHRTISIMSQVTKILLRVILKRIRTKISPEISEHQFGFVAGKGTANAVFSLRMLAERCLDVQKNVFICFVDYEKAFDKVRHEQLLEILKNLMLDGKDLQIIKNLYWNQRAAVRVAGSRGVWQDIKRGVRQGCVLSPDLFNIYSETIMNELIGVAGVNIGGRNVNNLRYADDTALIADSQEKLQELLDIVVRESASRGLKVNAAKTQVMVISKGDTQVPANIVANNQQLKQVRNFKYLGSTISEDGRSEPDINSRIAMAKTAFNKVKPLLTNRSIAISLRRRFLKTYVWSTMLYGCEAWNISNAMHRKIEAAEMWFLRRMLRISWTEHATNQSVLERAGTRREMMRTIRQKQLRFLGHVMREGKLENICVTGRIEGRRGRGRPRLKYMDTLARAVGDGLRAAELLQMAHSRTQWRSMVDNVPWDTSLR